MRILYILLFSFLLQTSYSQFNIGVVSGGDWYHRYVNPLDGSGADRSAGSALLNGNLGLKVFVGAPAFSLSVESYANSGALALNIEEYKGLGSIAFPVLAKLNFRGLSGFGIVEEDNWGWSIGGGIQWSRTEWYGLSSAARAQGVNRELFQNYVVEISYGTGTKSKIQEFFVRYGFNADASSNVLNLGMNTTFSIPFMKLPDFNLNPDGNKEEEEIIKI